MLPAAAAKQSSQHTDHVSLLSSLDSRRVRLRFPGHLSEAKSHPMARGGESSISMKDSHGNPLGRSREFDELKVCQRNKSELESRADRLAPIPGCQFLEDVPKMGFDRGRRQSQIAGQPLRGVTLGNAAKDLHLPRGEIHLSRIRKRRRLGDSSQDLWDHSPGDRALAAHGRQQRPLQLAGADVLEDVAGAANLNHPQEIVA